MSYLVQENSLGQKFRVTAVLYCGHKGLAVAGTSDDLDSSVNYAEAYEYGTASIALLPFPPPALANPQ